MEFTPNQTLGNYRLVAKIGEGGMGVVWRAVDVTLDREVAIKVLPEHFADDPDRLSRFEREARLLASLNHPGIATIHGLHQARGVHFLAMELVPGTDLARRLEAGPVPVEEALAIALKISEALEAAHDSGVVHRDLKPANIQVTPDGKVKILDFGLAKAVDADPSGHSGSLSPTMTTPAFTRMGLILGTAAYMSPEQAKGKPVDRRADIWAFGCILYEMLAGHRPFIGEGVSELMAAVIMSPVEFKDLPAAIPTRIRTLVRRCLEKDPRRRLRDMGEARYALEETLAGTTDEVAAAPVAAAARRSSAALVARALAAAAVAAVLTASYFLFLAPAPAPAPVRRFAIPAKGSFRSTVQGGMVQISPDGRLLAHVEEGKLYVRPLSRLDSTLIPTTAEPSLLFWSPDSAFIGYTAGGKLWKAPAAGGQSSAITDIKGILDGGSSASWCPDGRIVLGTGAGGILRVSSLGGDFEEVIPVLKDKEGDLHSAYCMPDGSILFVPHLVNARPSILTLWANGQRKELVKLAPDQDIWFPIYSPAGYILYHRHPANAGIWAVPFSLKRHETTGEPFLVAQDGDVPSVSNDGTLVHVTGTVSRLTQMVWVDRAGKVLGPIGPPQEQWPFPEISPDGRRLAIAAKENDISDIWIHDIERGTRTRLDAGTALYSTEAWSPDASHITFQDGQAAPTIKVRSTDGRGETRTVHEGWSASYSADGRYLLYAQGGQITPWTISYIDTKGDGKPVPLVHENDKTDAIWPRLSPDGRYFAYVSNESTVDEVYIKRFPSGEGKWQVSVGGGTWPRWSRKGDRIFFVQRETLMEVDVTLGPEPHLGKPRTLFTRKPLGWPLIFSWSPGFDVSAQGDKFVIVQALNDKQAEGGVVVLENWTGEFVHPQH
ncbi:MAG TPA: protein kinase [Patescibacteria group bacterium]|nr:protein kinase [Patescibacteria group bacterium]